MFKAKVRLINQQDNNLRGYADVDVDGIVTIRNARIIEGENGLFVSMPSIKDRNENYRPICRVNDNYWQDFIESVIYEYNTELRLAEIRAELETNIEKQKSESEQEAEEPEPVYDQANPKTETLEPQMTL